VGYAGRNGVAGFGRPVELERGDHQWLGAVQWRTISGSPTLDGGTLVNAGNLIDSVSFALTTRGSVISNLAGATLLFAADSGTYFGGSGGRGTITTTVS